MAFLHIDRTVRKTLPVSPPSKYLTIQHHMLRGLSFLHCTVFTALWRSVGPTGMKLHIGSLFSTLPIDSLCEMISVKKHFIFVYDVCTCACLGVFECMWMCASGHMGSHTRVKAQRPAGNLGSHLQEHIFFLFWNKNSHWPGADELDGVGWPVRPGGASVFWC